MSRLGKALLLSLSLGLVSAAGASATPPTPPTIGTQWVSGLTAHNAVIHAEINPNGSLTKYKLQIDTTGHFNFDQNDTCALHPPAVACGQIMISGEPLPPGLHEPPEGSIPAGSDPVEVSANLASLGSTLEPETTYYYRAIAASGVPEVEGPTQTFTTPSDVPGPPIVTNVGLSGLIKTDRITIHATIDPHGLDTTYQVVIYEPCPPHPKPGEATCWEELIYPLPEETIEADEGKTTVSVSNISNNYNLHLQPGDYYKWALKVENEGGPVSGPAHPFVTRQRPSIQGESVSGITETDATLNAQITPGMWGHEGDEFDEVGAYYQFQLVEDPSEYRPEIGCPDLSAAPPSVQCLGPMLLEGLYGEAPAVGPFDFDSTDLPFDSLGGELASQSVGLDLQDAGTELMPRTTYHYRVVTVLRAPGVDTINWEAPPVYGPDQTFTTPPYTKDEGSSQAQGHATTAGGDKGSDPPRVHKINCANGKAPRRGKCVWPKKKKKKRHGRPQSKIGRSSAIS
ncbi:MAG TPA: hypothetical protein VG518_05500 [Solirubrobacterales bacterium]|nr:hypothetical protein [Solirubrobacterales bacterium]